MYNVIPITSKITVDCGATCLQMMLKYYDIDVDLKTLIEECETTPVGCTAGGIKRAGEKHGLDIHAYNMSADELIKQDRPAIIHWRSNHFCVFCGMNEEGKVVICNPDRGRYPLHVKSFANFYCGVALFNGVPEDIREPYNPTKGKTIMTAPNGDKYEIIIGDDGSVRTKIAESERGMLL